MRSVIVKIRAKVARFTSIRICFSNATSFHKIINELTKIDPNKMQLDFFDYMALVVFGIIISLFVSVVVVIGSLPGKIAERRNHPQAKAINVAAWISLLTLGVLWPIVFVWAFTEVKPSPSNQ